MVALGTIPTFHIYTYALAPAHPPVTRCHQCLQLCFIFGLDPWQQWHFTLSCKLADELLRWLVTSTSLKYMKANSYHMAY